MKQNIVKLIAGLLIIAAAAGRDGMQAASAETLEIDAVGQMTTGQEIEVEKNQTDPDISIADLSEAAARMKEQPDGGYRYVAMIKNDSSVTIKKLIYVYKIRTGRFKTKEVNLTINNLKAGKVSKPASVEGDYRGNKAKMKLLRMELHVGNTTYVYRLSGKSKTLVGQKAETSPLKFLGFTEGQSLCRDIPYLTVYSDRREGFDFTKFLRVSDRKDKNPKIRTDTSKINWKKSGRYKVFFAAKDKVGNIARTWCWVDVAVPGEAESTADGILASIGAASGSDEQKARKIYQYIRNRMSYISHADHPEYRAAALNGLRDCSGDCYTYYAISRLLLTRAGIPNLMVTRYPETSRHFWNLVYVNGGWYHFDTTPRSAGGTFCLLTDAQMHGLYPGETFSFQEELYPARAEKKIILVTLNNCRRQLFSVTVYTAEEDLIRQLIPFASIVETSYKGEE